MFIIIVYLEQRRQSRNKNIHNMCIAFTQRLSILVEQSYYESIITIIIPLSIITPITMLYVNSKLT